MRVGAGNVSVPLRGLGSWKAVIAVHGCIAKTQVSVPLRGLGSWKVLWAVQLTNALQSFSPLAGIRFVERMNLV